MNSAFLDMTLSKYISTVVALLALIVSSISLYFSLIVPHRKKRRIDLFCEVRQYLKDNIPKIIKKSLIIHSKYIPYHDLPIITKKEWIFDKPQLLEFAIKLDAEKNEPPSITKALKKTRHYWPEKRYSQTIGIFDKPRNWYNGLSYRLLEVSIDDNNTNCQNHKYSGAKYWDMYDTTEVLFYEAALMHLRSHGNTIIGPYRKFLKSPFNLNLRCAIPGIDTLTIRQGNDSSSFYIQQRDASNVASAFNTLGIVPAGEFQPSDDNHDLFSQDFNLWFSILREYVEELLGVEDLRNQPGAPIDYERTEPYALIHKAYQEKQIQVYMLGLGLHPVTWKPTIFTTALFKEDVFDKLFNKIVIENKEGILQLKKRGHVIEGLPFNEETVFYYINNDNVLPVARAGLALAWKFKKEMSIVPY